MCEFIPIKNSEYVYKVEGFLAILALAVFFFFFYTPEFYGNEDDDLLLYCPSPFAHSTGLSRTARCKPHQV